MFDRRTCSIVADSEKILRAFDVVDDVVNVVDDVVRNAKQELPEGMHGQN